MNLQLSIFLLLTVIHSARMATGNAATLGVDSFSSAKDPVGTGGRKHRLTAKIANSPGKHTAPPTGMNSFLFSVKGFQKKIRKQGRAEGALVTLSDTKKTAIF